MADDKLIIFYAGVLDNNRWLFQLPELIGVVTDVIKQGIVTAKVFVQDDSE